MNKLNCLELTFKVKLTEKAKAREEHKENKEGSHLHNKEVQGEEVNIDVDQVLMKVVLHSWFFMVLRESFPRQVDQKSRGPQGQRSWNSQGGRKDKLFSSTFLRFM